MNTIITQNSSEIHTNHTGCSLCNQPVLEKGIWLESVQFCCHGCQAVYEILSSKEALHTKENHPIFLQAVEYGLISNPTVNREGKKLSPDRWVIQIEEMWCPACATFISLMLGRLKGIRSSFVDYMTDLAAIDYDPMKISKEEILKKIRSWGYAPLEITDEKSKGRQFSLVWRLSIAFFCALNVMMFTYPLFSTFFDSSEEGIVPLLSWVSLGLTLPVVTYSAWPIYRRFYFGLKQGFLGMEALVVLGIAASLAVSIYEMAIGSHRVYFDTVTMLIALLLFGKTVEQKSKMTSKEAQFKLNLMLPRKGRKKIHSGQFEIVPIKEIFAGDLIQAYAGESLVLDGIVVAGDALLDESSMTGESTPILKKVGDPVLSGTMLLSGLLEVKITSGPEESSLKKLIRQVEGELLHKTKNQQKADLIAHWMTPLLLIIAFAGFFSFLSLGFSFQEALLRAISALLIACPCAIGIASPLAESRLIDAFSANGAIVRNRNLFEKLAKATLFVFDKTGTVTEGKLEVVKGLDSLSEKQKKRLKSLSSCSLHPVSRAIASSIMGETLSVENLQEVLGKGLSGFIEGATVSLGSPKWFQERKMNLQPLTTLNTLSCYEEGGVLVSQLELKDRLREGALNLPVRKILLSGDCEEAVSSLANSLGFLSYTACMNPLEKQQRVHQLRSQGEIVVFVGDGMNDAPSLAAADVGISVLQASDMAFHASDLYLLNGRLDLLEDLVALAKKGEKIQRQNFFWAFFYNALGIPLALAGMLSPLFATFAMTVSSLIVLFNSKRITSQGSLFRNSLKS